MAATPRPLIAFFYAQILSLVTLATLSISSSSLAQSGSTSDEISLHLGWIMPNQIEGVTEMMAMYGLGYAFGGDSYLFDITGYNSNGYGASFTDLAFSVRGQVPLDPTLTAFVSAGGNINYYKPDNSDSRKTDIGLHVGVGGMLYAAESLWLRTDLRFMGGPGTSLWLGFALVFRSGSSGAK